MTTDNEQFKAALKVAIVALEIARDWNINELEVDTPADWNLADEYEDGMIPTYLIIEKLEEILKNS